MTNHEILVNYLDKIHDFGVSKGWYEFGILFIEDGRIQWNLDQWDWLKKNGLHPGNNKEFRYFFKELHFNLFFNTFDSKLLNDVYFNPIIKVKFNFTNHYDKKRNVTFEIHKYKKLIRK